MKRKYYSCAACGFHYSEDIAAAVPSCPCGAPMAETDKRAFERVRLKVRKGKIKIK